MDNAKSLILKRASSEKLFNELMKSIIYLFELSISVRYTLDSYSQISSEVLLTIDNGFAERYVFFLFESETERC